MNEPPKEADVQAPLPSYLKPDVLLLGNRNKVWSKNPGNRFFTILIRERQQEYQQHHASTTTTALTPVCSTIRKEIMSFITFACGGKFLVPVPSGLITAPTITRNNKELARWVEASPSVVQQYIHSKLMRRIPFSTSTCRRMDVLTVGVKSKIRTNHPGNVFYRELIDERRVEYRDADQKTATRDSPNKRDRSMIVQEIISLITYPCGGKFLERSPIDENRWQEVPSDIVKRKIMTALNRKVAPVVVANEDNPSPPAAVAQPQTLHQTTSQLPSANRNTPVVFNTGALQHLSDSAHLTFEGEPSIHRPKRQKKVETSEQPNIDQVASIIQNEKDVSSRTITSGAVEFLPGTIPPIDYQKSVGFDSLSEILEWDASFDFGDGSFLVGEGNLFTLNNDEEIGHADTSAVTAAQTATSSPEEGASLESLSMELFGSESGDIDDNLDMIGNVGEGNLERAPAGVVHRRSKASRQRFCNCQARVLMALFLVTLLIVFGSLGVDLSRLLT